MTHLFDRRPCFSGPQRGTQRCAVPTETWLGWSKAGPTLSINMFKIFLLVVVSKIFYFYPYLGKWSNLTFWDGLKPPTSFFWWVFLRSEIAGVFLPYIFHHYLGAGRSIFEGSCQKYGKSQGIWENCDCFSLQTSVRSPRRVPRLITCSITSNFPEMSREPPDIRNHRGIWGPPGPKRGALQTHIHHETRMPKHPWRMETLDTSKYPRNQTRTCK